MQVQNARADAVPPSQEKEGENEVEEGVKGETPASPLKLNFLHYVLSCRALSL